MACPYPSKDMLHCKIVASARRVLSTGEPVYNACLQVGMQDLEQYSCKLSTIDFPYIFSNKAHLDLQGPWH